MTLTALDQLIPVLQTAVGPMILISGVGLFLLTMTNRMGRVVDRSRLLKAQLPQAGAGARQVIEAQLQVFLIRGKLLRGAIALISFSALIAALMIVVLFFSALYDLRDAWLVGALFVASMVCLCLSLLLFIKDVNLSLAALKFELQVEKADAAG